VTCHAFISYLRYRVAAKNRHGVHSPFVFDFVEKVLRQADRETFREKLAGFAGGKNMAFIREDDPAVWDAAFGRQERNEDTVIVFGGIHRTAFHSDAWQKIHDRPEVRLSMDLYHYGLLFFRKEFREKQHFILRFPS